MSGERDELRADAERLDLGVREDAAGDNGEGQDGNVELAVGVREDGAIIVNFGVSIEALVLTRAQAKELRRPKARSC